MLVDLTWYDAFEKLTNFAGMAYQLTSIGVEFSKQEMKRIFRTIPSPSDARPWGLGKINSPDSLVTTLPDAAWNAVTLPY